MIDMWRDTKKPSSMLEGEMQTQLGIIPSIIYSLVIDVSNSIGWRRRIMSGTWSELYGWSGHLLTYTEQFWALWSVFGINILFIWVSQRIVQGEVKPEAMITCRAGNHWEGACLHYPQADSTPKADSAEIPNKWCTENALQLFVAEMSPPKKPLGEWRKNLWMSEIHSHLVGHDMKSLSKC